MKKDSLKVNFVFQTVYQVLMLVIPLILAPYLTRTLGGNSLGVYTYVHSISYYFVLFSMLGIAKYGQRLIAQNSNDDLKLRKSFWGLFYLHVILSVLAITFYILFVFCIVKENRQVFIMDFFFVLSALFDITWFFYGLENFRSVVYRNTIVKVVECILIFLFVHNSNDVVVYTIICSFAVFIGQVAMLPVAMRIAPPIKVGWSEIFIHMKPLLTLALAVLAVTLYTIFDKTLLGIFSIKEDVAFYEYSDRIIRIPLTFITIIGTVMLPRACRLVADGNNSSQQIYLKYSAVIVSVIASLSFWVLLLCADDLALGYFGEGFSACGTIMICLSPIILIAGIGDIVRNQFLIPNSLDRQYTIGVCLSAILNLFTSISLLIILPSSYKIFGAVLGTLFAELFGTGYQIVICRSYYRYRSLFVPICTATGAGIVSYILMLFIPIDLGHALANAVTKGMILTILFFASFLLIIRKFDRETFHLVVPGLKKIRLCKQ